MTYYNILLNPVSYSGVKCITDGMVFKGIDILYYLQSFWVGFKDRQSIGKLRQGPINIFYLYICYNFV